MERNDKCRCGSGKKYKNCCLKRTDIKAIQAISVCVEKIFNEALKANYELFFVEISECDNWLYAHCYYIDSSLLSALIMYHIEKGKYVVLVPERPYSTNDIVDWVKVSNDNIDFLKSDKMIELTQLVDYNRRVRV